VINLEHHNPGAFEDYDVYALQNLAAQVAITIQMIRHYEQINHDALVREGLLKVGEAILITQEPHKVLQILVDKIKEALQADVVTLYTHDRTGPKDSLQANYAGTLMNPGTTAKLLKIRRDSVVRRILHDGIPIFASDTLHDPFMALGDFAREERIRSSAGIPLLIGDEKVGVFFVNYRRPHQFSDRQQDDFLLFATQAALAIQNALRFEDLKKQKSLVGSRTALAFMGLANSVWGHSIEGNVINIRNLATLMLQDLKEEGVPAGLLTRLAGRVDLIKSQAQEVLDKEMIPKLSIENAQVILLNDMIRERVEQLKSLGAYKSISFRLGLRADVRVKTAPEWLRTALDILIDNAAKAMQDAPKKSISIRTIVAGSLVKIAVKDTGKGIAPDLLDRILSRQIVRDNQEGLGMGLLLAQAIMQAYNGDIELLETGPKGTTFLMLLPVVA
jgi:signal transduction histidine kinase